ncbi:MAG: nucleotidyl transferase AbiEii/AbiGii toxin family protein [Candidatus Hydrogenedentes bacterium]|nr:nucleotidyl transferase AbiEii/AbiGii toxin family protein [Candidatus Hydrogenedentota bacterium]
MKFRKTILSRRQANVLRILSPIATPRGFYLAGGTALAILLGHRRSVDFDWFVRDALEDSASFAQELRNELPGVEVLRIAQGTLEIKVSEVPVTLLRYAYPLLDDLIRWPEYDCCLASLKDLACMKLSALAQRGSKRDFVDVYALLRNTFSLAEIIEAYRTKYSIEDIGHLLASLAYFDDADKEPTPEMCWKVRWAEIRSFIRSAVEDYS